MEVILLETVSFLGNRGDTANVKPGYARNYLFPRKLAVPATTSNRRAFEEEERTRERRERHEILEAREAVARIADVSCTIPVQVSEGDKLYGSVTAADIANELRQQGFDVGKKQVVLEEPIRKLGVYTVALRLHREVSASIKVWVVKE